MILPLFHGLIGVALITVMIQVERIPRSSIRIKNLQIKHEETNQSIEVLKTVKNKKNVKASSSGKAGKTVKKNANVAKVTKVSKKFSTTPKSKKEIPKNSSKKPISKPTLDLAQSVLLNTIELREKISKLATEEVTKGLKYLTFKEFTDCETINNEITSLINKSKKMIILTGAGISCNAGIPDFRSDNGLYNKKLNENTIKGKDMFDISVYRSIETIQIFNGFIYELYQQALNSTPTMTHRFIKKLQDLKKLIKCYTQNIDGLERECGLKTEFHCNDWNDTDVVQLHGDLHQLCCNKCQNNYKWNDIYDDEGNVKLVRTFEEQQEQESDDGNESDDLMILSQNSIKSSSNSINSIFSNKLNDSNSISSIDEEEEFSMYGTKSLIECPKCIDAYENKMKLGKRCLESSIGIIRPNIVLYGEEHPYSEAFAKNLNKDLNKKPNVLLIFGTSLKVTGVKNLVKKLSKKIHENEKGLVVLINKEPVSYSSWKDYIDYQIVSDCDAFCEAVEAKLPNLNLM